MTESNESVIESWCNTVANELAQRKFYDIQECKNYAKVILNLAISQIIDNNLCDLEMERANLVHKKNEEMSKRYDGRIAQLNVQIKSRRKAFHLFETEVQYHALKSYVKEKVGVEFLEAFYKDILKLGTDESLNKMPRTF